MNRSLFLVAVLVAGFTLPASAQLIYTAPNSTGLFAGDSAGNGSLTGTENTGIGSGSLESVTSGFWNTGIGSLSLNALTEGTSNIALGTWSMISMVNGARNTAAGQNSLGSSENSSNNAAFGYNSLYTLHTGGDSYNTALGYTSLFSLYEGTGNTGVGANSGASMGAGTNGTFVGYLSGASGDYLTNASAIGYNAQVATSNSLVLGGTGDDAVKVGIGTTSPTQALDVNANTIRVRQDRTPASSSETCAKGEMAWDGSYLYVCVATNTWKRSALSSF